MLTLVLTLSEDGVCLGVPLVINFWRSISFKRVFVLVVIHCSHESIFVCTSVTGIATRLHQRIQVGHKQPEYGYRVNVYPWEMAEGGDLLLAAACI